MDDFPGILARDFGLRPRDKSAPMSASRSSGIGSGSSRSATANSASSSTPTAPAFDDVFGGPPSYPNHSSHSSFQSLFDRAGDPDPKPRPASSMPVYDKPVYDDDIFDGIPGMKSTGKVNYDDVFGSMSSPSKGHEAAPPPYDDDLLASLGKGSGEAGRSGRKKEEDFGGGFDDLLPGFGGSSPTKNNKRYHFI